MGRFPQTRWSLVVRAGGSPDAAGRKALDELCEAYWPPLFAFLRARGMAREQAEETVQGFFAAFLGRGGFDRADQDRGRLRTFLLASLQNFVSHRRDHEAAAKRGTFVTDTIAADVIEQTVQREAGLQPEQVFMRAWARRVLAATLEELGRDYERRGKGDVFEAFRGSLVEVADADAGRAAAQRLGMSAGAAKVALHRLRKRFGERLRRQVADTVDDPKHIDAELRALIAVMSDL